MADKLKTTSSISSDTHQASPARPNSREAELMTKLADHINESYRMVKHRQQKLFDLTNQMKMQDESSTGGRLKGGTSCATDDWQEVYSPKNKLKRKKTLSASLTSVTDSVNQEKRTRIEGIQLNCRGKLNLKENINATTASAQAPVQQPRMVRPDRLAGKPPLPPNTNKANSNENNPPKVAAAPPPPRLKRKLQENVQTIQKLNALTEQLRLEINELKSNLTTERGAVRVLRAQNEAESRKWKNEAKKLQSTVELLKKNGASRKCETASANADNLPQAAVGGLVNYEIQRLTNEINAMKEANKALEEKKVINCDADRRKAADIRELKDSYEIRLTQIQKSAKTEISRLLEEIKTKERNIGQLKKDLQTLQNAKSNASRNATTNNQNNSTNKTTTLNLNKKPKNSNNNQTPPAGGCCNAKVRQQPQRPKPANDGGDTSAEKKGRTNSQDVPHTQKDAGNSNEISKLKNIELINNTKYVTTNLQRSTKILSSRDDDDERNVSASLKSIHKQLKALEIPEVHNDCIDLLNDNGQFATLLTTTTNLTPNACTFATLTKSSPPPSHVTDASVKVAPTCDATDHFEDPHITQELTQHLNTKAIQDAKQTDLHNHSHSDSDSALSSAPPSISPQPPANGMEPTDIWQTIRSYSNDIEKLQKEVDSLQKENEKLRQELNGAKDQIIDLESTALEQNSNNEKHHQLLERIKILEDQEHQLQAEANDLREQNELLEFRILELEDNTSDKWSLQSTTNPTTDVPQGNQNVWSCSADGSQPKADPFEMLFGSNSHTSTTSSVQLDSGIISPQSQGHQDDLIDITNDELCRRLGDLLKKTSLEEDEKHCLQQVLNLVQQLDALTPRSGSSSLLAATSSEEASSMDLVKSRISEYSSSPSSPLSSIRSTNDKSVNVTTKSAATSGTATPRIVATVQPYNSTPASYSQGPASQQIVPHNTPTDSPRKSRSHHWHNNSLSESGVFVESDFLSDSGENNVCTQTDFEDCSSTSGHSTNYSLHPLNTPTKNVPAHFNHLQQIQHPPSPNLSDQKRLQYYKDRLELLEGKVLIYESSGDVQAKRLAERLQREILLEKEVRELRDRVEFLESENCSLEEEKCEFEEAENDTRLRLQRLEVELEILSQRNVELEMSREALSAKYKDCHSECLILRDDLATSETHIRHLEEDKQKAKENFEFLHNILPVLLICNTACTLSQTQEPRPPIEHAKGDMGNEMSALNLPTPASRIQGRGNDTEPARNSESCICHEREVQYLKDEVKCLRHQIKELNSRHYAAMESADSHWVDLEREYKEREEHFRTKEMCLKQKIQKLQDCLREDARSANEKICQLEEAEQGLKTCLVRVSKEHQKLLEDHQCLVSEFERFKEQHDQLREQQKPLTETLETEKKRNRGLIDELTFMRKLQQETENQSKTELDCVRGQMFDLKKEYLHIEVTNGELREEVATLELQVETLQKTHRDCEEKVRCLTDEIRTKDEICQKLEKRLERSEGYSLADELGDTPSKRFKREDVKDLQTASKGLGNALRHMTECERMLPTQKQFQTVARDVKKLADTLLQGESADEEVSIEEASPDLPKPVEETESVLEETTTENDTTMNRESVSIKIQNEINEHEVPSAQSPMSPPPMSNEPSLFGPPLATSSPIEHLSLEDVFSGQYSAEAENENSDVKVKLKLKEDEVTLTVGMAFMPQFAIADHMLPSCSSLQKKVICEVPSELRKLSTPSSKPNRGEIMHTQLCPNRENKKRSRRCAKRRMARGRVGKLPARARPIGSTMNVRLFHDASDLDIYESEVLQRNLSYGSFHSLQEEGADVSFESLDAFTEYQIKKEMVDMETETFVEKSDSSVQVGDEVSIADPIDGAPAHIICFLAMVKSSISKTVCGSSGWLSKRWEVDVEFREGLELLSAYAAFKPDDNSNEISIESYEGFVKAMSCLYSLQDIFKPHSNPMLMQIEEQINERLLSFHTRKMESQFYCTVYYPVKRPSPVHFSQLYH